HRETRRARSGRLALGERGRRLSVHDGRRALRAAARDRGRQGSRCRARARPRAASPAAARAHACTGARAARARAHQARVRIEAEGGAREPSEEAREGGRQEAEREGSEAMKPTITSDPRGNRTGAETPDRVTESVLLLAYAAES